MTTNVSELEYKMWAAPTTSHASSVLGLLKHQNQDCTLIFSQGEKVRVPSLLLAFYSPMLAQFLAEQDENCISLPEQLQSLDEVFDILDILDCYLMDMTRKTEEETKDHLKDRGMKEDNENLDQKKNSFPQNMHVKLNTNLSNENISKSYTLSKAWCQPTEAQACDVLSLIKFQKKDIALVSSCGGKVEMHSLLLALYSPLLARLLEGHQGHAGGVTIPFPIKTINRLVDMMYGASLSKDQEVEEAAKWLGINISMQENKKEEDSELKQEEGSEQSSRCDDVDFRGMEDHEIYLEQIAAQKYESNARNKDIKDVKHIIDDCSKNSNKKEEQERSYHHGSWAEMMKRKTIKCDFCESSFITDRGGKKKHMLLKHMKVIECDQCSESFTDFDVYIKHLNKCQQFVCNICGEVKLCKKTFDSHVESKHGQGVSCHHCGKHYTTKAACQLHISNKHGKVEKEEACERCGKIFKDVKRHLKTCGTIPKKKLPCISCDKTFSSKEALKYHVKRIHENIRDKACEHCPYITYSNFNLRLHVTKMHKSKL